MSFDKTKAMRSAERFLSLGKIRSAISEYLRIVENDPKDFTTLNMLGDLYVKNSETREAVECYTKVAEHYNKQGFAHKAIAIYNKISRLQPNSMEVSAKLAQLYQSKGSIAEARAHYVSLAEQYQRKNQKTEALGIWKQIAELDPNNTDIYLKIAETCEQEDQPDDAAKAFTEAGLRLSEQGRFEDAVAAFSKALEIKKNYLRALNGMVKAQIGLGDSDEAAKILEGILEEQPYNRDILYLLVDCQLDMGKAAEAEQAIIKLVEQEPANYPKFLDLVKIHLASNDLAAAARILSISSEHLLVGGQSDEFLSWTNEILARNPEQVDGLRLLACYYSWQRDEAELKNTLERLAEAAHQNNSLDDEKYALSQLVMMSPLDADFARRLHEFNREYGFETGEFSIVENANVEVSESDALPENYEVEILSESNAQAEISADGHREFSFAVEGDAPVFEDAGGNVSSAYIKEFDFYNDDLETAAGEDENAALEFESVEAKASAVELKPAEKLKLQQEVESVEFYIAQGYQDLAEKSLLDLESRYGKQPEFAEIRARIDNALPTSANEMPNLEIGGVEQAANTPSEAQNGSKFESLDELKNEFAAEENAAQNDNDYETHYHTATAYREMGLLEDAIREFQSAISRIGTSGDTRRFFQCSTFLGLCFMEKQMPNLALMWYKRALDETADLTEEEKKALWYELGNAYETGGDLPKAARYFEQIYALDVDYRDLDERLRKVREAAAQAGG